MTDQMTGHENAGHEIAGMKMTDVKLQDMKMQDMKQQDIKEQDMKLTQKRRTFEAEYRLSRFSIASLQPIPIRKISRIKVEWA